MTIADSRVNQALQLFQAGRQGEGVLALNRLGAAGHGEALRILGELRWSGQLDPSPEAGRALFEKAAQAGDRQSRYYVTNLLGSGIAGPRNWPGALERLDREGRSDPLRARAAKLVAAMKLDGGGNPREASAGECVSEAPYVTRHKRLFSDSECAYVLAIAKPGYGPSIVYDSQRRLVRDPIRTSEGSTLHWLMEDPALHALNRRIAAASGSEADQGEAAQVLRYTPGQEYRAHFDFVPNADNQRHLTALVWLNHDYRGGETVFLRAGLELKGRRGDAIVFRNALADGSIDPMTEHAGRPVSKGTKYLYSRWIRTGRWAP
jgi:prolyl 4-hydroxylase